MLVDMHSGPVFITLASVSNVRSETLEKKQKQQRMGRNERKKKWFYEREISHILQILVFLFLDQLH